MRELHEGIEAGRLFYFCPQCKLRATRGVTEHEQIIDAVAQLVLAAIPPAARMVSDEFSADERQQLRELVKTEDQRSNGVFELSNLLNRLCSDTAHDPSRLGRLPQAVVLGEERPPKRKAPSRRSLD
jgi:hypothetical protein